MIELDKKIKMAAMEPKALRLLGTGKKIEVGMALTDKKNINLMNLIKKVHSVVENVDIEKHRQSQDHFGAILGN